MEKTREELLLEIENLRRRISELENREEASLLLLQNPNSIIMKVGRDGAISFVNEYARHLFNYTEEELVGEKLSDKLFSGEDDSREDFIEFIGDIAALPNTYRTFESRNVTKDGAEVWIMWTFRALKNPGGDVSEIVCIGNDITRKKYIEAELKKVSRTDQVTGLSTRKDFAEKYDLERYRFSRNGKSFTIMLATLTSLQKTVNRYGTDCGDSLMKHVAGITRNCLRKTDVVARWASEEIIMMLPETDTAGARSAAGKILESVSASPYRHKGTDIDIPLTFHIAFVEREMPLDDIVNGIYDFMDEAEDEDESGIAVCPITL